MIMKFKVNVDAYYIDSHASSIHNIRHNNASSVHAGLIFLLLKTILILFLLFFSQNLFSQSNFMYDSSEVEIKMPEESKIIEYQNDKNFIYEENPDTPVTIMDKIRYWFLSLFMKFFSNTGAAPYIRYVIIGLVATYIIVKLFNTNIRNVFYNPKKRIKIEHELLDKDLNKLNLEKLLNDSVNNKEFRKAVRYLFLKTLKILIATDLINKRIDKTNNEFVLELKKTKLIKEFRELVSFYEHGWYGNFDITDKQFSLIYEKYDVFLKKIN